MEKGHSARGCPFLHFNMGYVTSDRAYGKHARQLRLYVIIRHQVELAGTKGRASEAISGGSISVIVSYKSTPTL